MTLALRNPVSAALVFLALLSTVAVFTVARPRYQPAVQVENIDLAQQTHHSVSDVRAAFAAEGIRLTQAGANSASAMTLLGVGPLPWEATDVSVTVFPEKGVLGLGHGEWEEGVYERRVGNVLVHYGGKDEEVLAQVKRAVATLRPAARLRGAGFFQG